HPRPTLFPYTTLFRSRDGIETSRVAEVLVGQAVVDARDLHRAGQAGESSGDEHGDDDRPPHVHPGVARRLLALADGANLVTKRRSEEHTSELQSLRHL